MHGLIPIDYGKQIIIYLSKPLELFMSQHNVGRTLQTIHIVGYFMLIGLAYFYEPYQIPVLLFFTFLIIIFFVFGGCILTKAEMHYLNNRETIPHIIFNALGITFKDKETDYFWQKAGSLGVILFPVLTIIIYRLNNYY